MNRLKKYCKRLGILTQNYINISYIAILNIENSVSGSSLSALNIFFNRIIIKIFHPIYQPPSRFLINNIVHLLLFIHVGFSFTQFNILFILSRLNSAKLTSVPILQYIEDRPNSMASISATSTLVSKGKWNPAIKDKLLKTNWKIRFVLVPFTQNCELFRNAKELSHI